MMATFATIVTGCAPLRTRADDRLELGHAVSMPPPQRFDFAACSLSKHSVGASHPPMLIRDDSDAIHLSELKLERLETYIGGDMGDHFGLC